MSHYAKVVGGKVEKVIVAESDFFNGFVDSSPGRWIQTSYNTRFGKHLNGGTPLRGNYAGVGMNYNFEKDYFYYDKPYDMNGEICESWTFKEEDFDWHPPTPYPADGDDEKGYIWRESDKTWVEIVKE